MNVRILDSESQRREAVPILRQLFPDQPPAAVLEWTGREDYTLFGGFVDGALIGVAGLLVTDVLHHERHAWLYDLVIDEAHRDRGHGSALLEHVETWASERGCSMVALASPAAKGSVHRFYERRGYERWGHVLERGL